jgi:DNA-binding transcriptional regulator PaaX
MPPIRSSARWVLVLLAAEGVETAGRHLVRFWKGASRKGRLHAELRHLVAAGALGHRGSGPIDERLFHLTASGRKAVLGDLDPEARWARDWDGRWRVVLFDVPQRRADVRLRLWRRLREERLGWLQNSVWLSPDPVADLSEKLEGLNTTVESFVIIEGRPVGGGSDAELVAGAWDFERVAKLQASYLKLLHLQPVRSRSDALKDWSAWLQMEKRAWAEIARHDPFLPEPLLPRGYAGREVWRTRVAALKRAGEALLRGTNSV